MAVTTKLKLKHELRPYQQECLDYLSGYKHVLIGDEMGVGKTVECIALDALRRAENGDKGKTLVVAPLTGVLDQWVEEFEKWTDLTVRRVNEKKRHLLFEKEADVYIIHHEALRLMQDELAKREWLHFIIDEAHRIKNRKTKTSKAAKVVGKKAQYRTGATGTPVMNRPDEIWNLLNWLYPDEKSRKEADFKHWHKKLLNSYWRFYGRYIDYFEDPDYGYHKILGTKNEDELKDLLKPIFIRRLKKDVLAHLPPKQYQQYEVDLLPKQRRAYDAMKNTLIAWIGQNEDQPVVAPIVISQLIRLQQFALGFGRIEVDPQTGESKMYLEEPSAKLDALMDILDDLGDTQCVVFSTSKQALNMAQKRLEKAGISTAKVTGDVPQAKRKLELKRFKEGTSQVFMATIGAGGVGLNLQHCNTVVFLDRDWSPANNLQAEDRVHRSGQEHDSVHIIDIVARGTIDQKKDRTLKQKWQWVRDTVGA